MPFDIFAVGACNCACLNVTSTFYGCNSFTLNSYQLDIYNHSGGTLLQSVTTNGSGSASVTPTGSVWIQSHDGRFSGQTFTFPLSTVAMTVVASSYVCTDLCALPISKVLHATDPVYGPLVLNWISGVQWEGTFVVNYAGCAGYGCTTPVPSFATTWDIWIDNTTGATISGLNTFTCPDPAGTYSVIQGFTDSLTVTGCPPSFAGNVASNAATGVPPGIYMMTQCLITPCTNLTFTE